MKSKDVQNSSDEVSDWSDEESEDETPVEACDSFVIQAEKAFSLDQTFVLALSSICRGSTISLAAGLSDHSCQVLNAGEGLKTVAHLPNCHDKPLTNVFLDINSHLCYTSSLDGYVKAWDLRKEGKPVLQLKDDSDPNECAVTKPITCFDVAPNRIVLCAGTEEIDGDSFLLFWDTRAGSLHGGYWESHTEDVTNVRFHSNNSSRLLSASTDGLVNLFDINETSEDDALQNSFNVEDSIEKIEWHGDSSFSCTTLTAQLQVWDVEDASPKCSYSRKQIAKHARIKSTAACYLVDSYSFRNKTLLLTGSTHGKGDYLRSILVDPDKKSIALHGQFIGNKQIVRCSAVHEEVDTVVTGGEGGIISIWKKDAGSTPVKTKNLLKSHSTAEKVKSKPY